MDNNIFSDTYFFYCDDRSTFEGQLSELEKASKIIQEEKLNREKEFSNPNATIKIGTMFSGIGAIEYALKRLNLKSEILFASDIDNFAKQSYFANYEIDFTLFKNSMI